MARIEVLSASGLGGRRERPLGESAGWGWRTFEAAALIKGLGERPAQIEVRAGRRGGEATPQRRFLDCHHSRGIGRMRQCWAGCWVVTRRFIRARARAQESPAGLSRRRRSHHQWLPVPRGAELGRGGAVAVGVGRAEVAEPGVPVFSPHDLRHRRVSLLHLGGMPWARIGELVGHGDLVTTARTYTHVVADEAELDYAAVLR